MSMMSRNVRKCWRLAVRFWLIPLRLLVSAVRAVREVLGWRRRAEVAEAVATERQRTIESLKAALQMLNRGSGGNGSGASLSPESGEERARRRT